MTLRDALKQAICLAHASQNGAQVGHWRKGTFHACDKMHIAKR